MAGVGGGGGGWLEGLSGLLIVYLSHFEVAWEGEPKINKKSMSSGMHLELITASAFESNMLLIILSAD